MTANWQKAYVNLTDYISKNPEINISPRVIRIPSEYSDEFYSLHMNVRIQFLEDRMPKVLEKSRLLSTNYLKIREEVISMLSLEDISIHGSVEKFLYNPLDQLTKEIFNTLTILLKGEIDLKEYERLALAQVTNAFEHLYQSGYEKWIILSLLKLLRADSVFKVTPEEVTEEDTIRHGVQIEYRIPNPERSDEIRFKREVEVGFMVPDLLVHSAESNRYYSFTSEIKKALAAAINHSKKREWLPGDPNVVFESDIILIYVDTNLNDLSLVTDMNATCKADLILECKVLEKWYEKEGLNSILKHYAKYKPRMGTFIITLDPTTDSIEKGIMAANLAYKSQADMEHPKISFLQVGFDQTKLGPVISAL